MRTPPITHFALRRKTRRALFQVAFTPLSLTARDWRCGLRIIDDLSGMAALADLHAGGSIGNISHYTTASCHGQFYLFTFKFNALKRLR